MVNEGGKEGNYEDINKPIIIESIFINYHHITRIINIQHKMNHFAPAGKGFGFNTTGGP